MSCRVLVASRLIDRTSRGLLFQNHSTAYEVLSQVPQGDCVTAGIKSQDVHPRSFSLYSSTSSYGIRTFPR
ncbi:unnamed protein product [Diplocarpon coronariae]